MGAEPYDYVVEYEADIQSALDKLRAKVFADGDYDGAEFGPSTPEEALEMTEEEGTRSILDISRVSPSPDFFCAAPFDADELQAYFGTTKPTLEQIAEADDLWEEMERGQARYVIAYDGDAPQKIYFAGYSFD